MNPRVKDVKANDDFKLLLTFEDGEKKVFDVKPYLHTGVFKELADINIFKTVHVNFGSVSWKNGQDFCPDTLYLESKEAINGKE